MNYQQLIKDHGKVNHSGQVLALTQNPFVDDTGLKYLATALTEEQCADDFNPDFDAHYLVMWDATSWDDSECAEFDESNACDWDCPASVTAVNAE